MQSRLVCKQKAFFFKKEMSGPKMLDFLLLEEGKALFVAIGTS